MVPDTTVHPVGGTDSYPLSPLQQGMLFHRLEARTPGVDVEQCICELHEEIDAAKFERAWREAMARHAILRTGFVWENGDAPRQVVYPAPQVRLDFRHEEFGSETEARHGLEVYLADDRRAGFASLDAPLLRVALLKGGPRRHWWVVTFHHLLLDGRALVLLFREVHEIHDALVAGEQINLPPAKPYRAYIDWLQTLDQARAEKFWRQQLRGLTAPTVLPIGHATPVEIGDPNASRGELAIRLSEAKTRDLRAAAARYQVTMNTLVQAAWAIVLSRYTGEEDVAFGAVRACRHIPAVEGAGSIVGLFINTVPVRVRVPAEAPVGEWLNGLREQWVALREFEHTPLMKAQQWSEIAPGRALFETLFNFQDPSWDCALKGLGGNWGAREFDIRSQPNYPLAVDAYGGSAVIVKMLYDRRRFADDAIVRLLGHYRVTLEALASDAARVGDLPLLTPGEREEMFGRWQGEQVVVRRDRCVHELLAEHAARMPNAIAVSDAKTTLTYAELNRRAEQLSAGLRAFGVGPEIIVAVHLPRSVEMVVAWLATLKAGGAFLPIDPKYPEERIAFMLEDSGAAVVINSRGLQTRGSIVRSPNVDAQATTANLAYVIYTSGSTGQPKGVEVEHRALLNLVGWHQHAFKVTAADRATQLASPAFDASVWEVWPYLACGASVHMPDEETRLSPAQLWRWFAAQQITISFLPTPLAEAAMNEPRPDGLVLRTLLTGGDKLKRRPPADFPCELVNNYGPTENAVVSTSGVVPRGADEPDAFTPTIGRPVANTQCYILDRQLRPVPVGVSGELFVGGDSLARGYLNRAELTAEKFIASPFAANARLYRTGDVVRWTAEGEIEFLGRLDGQVKIRGCRIELGEIEAALHAHASVRESIVLARPDERGQLQLVAYALRQSNPIGYFPEGARDGGHARGDNLEAQVLEFLRAKLPSYMVPGAIVFLEAWPLTANGKVDRAALPAPAARAAQPIAFAEPTTATEQAVARVWAEILGHAPIGRNDNFFELGGHSLLAAQVISRLNAALQSALTVRAVFDQPTVAGLAREVEARRGKSDGLRPITARVKRRAAAERAEAEVLT